MWRESAGQWGVTSGKGLAQELVQGLQGQVIDGIKNEYRLDLLPKEIFFPSRLLSLAGVHDNLKFVA
jgi:hypothetical protein